jgi:hypothetical protein
MTNTETAPVNRYGKVVGHEVTARGTIAYVSDPVESTTTRIRIEREDDGAYVVSGDTVNARGAKIHMFSTQVTLSEGQAKGWARAYWMAANAKHWSDTL